MTTATPPTTATRVFNPPAPGTPQWRKTISASKIPSLIKNEHGDYSGFGYDSAWEVWRTMTSDYTKEYDEETLAMFAEGHDAEPSAIQRALRHLAEDTGTGVNEWRVETQASFTDPELPFDNIATLDALVTHPKLDLRVNIEAKRPRFSTFRPGWIIQTKVQAGTAKTDYGLIVTDPIYGDPEVFKVDNDPDEYARIMAHVHNFWFMHIRMGIEPDPGSSGSFADWFCQNHPNVDEAKAIEVEDELMAELIQAIKAEADATELVEKLRNQVIKQMGKAKTARYKGVRVIGRTAGKFSQKRIPKEFPDLLADPRVLTQKVDPELVKQHYPEIYKKAQGNGSMSLQRATWAAA